MTTLPPKYSDTQLRSILDGETSHPEGIAEQDFLTEIKYNPKIKWRVNPFLFRRNLLPYLLDKETFKKWRIFKFLNWVIVLFILGFAFLEAEYRILFFLIVYLILILPVDHWIFIFNISALIIIKLIFKIGIDYFWHFVGIAFLGYLMNKHINEMIERIILKRALSNSTIFWRCYSNKIIWIDETALNSEWQRLSEKYGELRL